MQILFGLYNKIGFVLTLLQTIEINKNKRHLSSHGFHAALRGQPQHF